MTCAGCQATVQKALRATPGVADASVNLLMHEARVVYDPSVLSPENIVAAINDTGYSSRLPAPAAGTGAGAAAHGHGDAHGFRPMLIKALVSLALGLAAMAVSMATMGAADAASMRLVNQVQLAVTLFVMVWAGGMFYTRRLVRAAPWQQQHEHADRARHRRGVPLLGSPRRSAPHWFHAAGAMPDVYYEAVIIIIALVLLGNALEARAKGQTTRALRGAGEAAALHRARAPRTAARRMSRSPTCAPATASWYGPASASPSTAASSPARAPSTSRCSPASRCRCTRPPAIA